MADETFASSGKETFKSTKVKVVGISSDPVEKQREFVDKQKLTVRLHLVYILLISDCSATQLVPGSQ